MTAVAVDRAALRTEAEARAALPPSRVLADIALIAGRNLRKVLRNTRLIVFTTIQPIMQLVLFAYVFTGVARVQSGSYRDFVVPAVIVQTMVFSGMTTGIGIANDLHSGMIDRFRSLPIARSAFLVGRTVSDSLRLGIQALLLIAVSLIIGFRFHAGVAGAAGMAVVVVVFGMALTAFSAWIGLAVQDPETVQAASFIPILPLVFTSSAFAPVKSLPGWMQPVARANPVTAAIDSARGLALGNQRLLVLKEPGTATALWHFGVWWVAIVAVFTALAVHRYRLG
jgi:ABC-2 type transport system permease protein/oleandomycin transport system permease protein